MRRWLACAVAFLLCVIDIASTKSATGDSVLVVLEKDLPKEQFSKFFAGLEGMPLSFVLITLDIGHRRKYT